MSPVFIPEFQIRLCTVNTPILKTAHAHTQTHTDTHRHTYTHTHTHVEPVMKSHPAGEFGAGLTERRPAGLLWFSWTS